MSTVRKLLMESVINPRQPGRFAVFEDMPMDYCARRAIEQIHDALDRPAEVRDAMLRDAITLLALARVKGGT